MNIGERVKQLLREGKSEIIPTIVEIKEGNGGWKYLGPWRAKKSVSNPQGKADGNPNSANLEKYMREYHASLKLGGVNYHISHGKGFIPYASEARVRSQKTGEVLATWGTSMFQVMDDKGKTDDLRDSKAKEMNLKFSQIPGGQGFSFRNKEGVNFNWDNEELDFVPNPFLNRKEYDEYRKKKDLSDIPRKFAPDNKIKVTIRQ